MKVKDLIVSLIPCLMATAYADTNTITLTLASPSSEMLAYEWESLSITISNNSPKAIYIVKDPSEIMSSQIVLDFDKPQLRYREEFDFSETPKKIRFAQRQREGNLQPGESHTWKLPPCYGDLTRALLDCGTTEVTALFPVGGGQWIRSNTLPLKIYPDDEKKLVLDEPYIDKRTQKEDRVKLYETMLGKKAFLFTSWGERICELQSGETPEFQFDAETETLSISLPDRQRIRYDLKEMKVSRGAD